MERASEEEKSVLWWIPLTLKAENSGAATGVAAAAAAAAGSGGFSTATWGTTFDYDAGRDGYIKGNLNQTGYYRVNYPSVVWQKLGAAIHTQVRGGRRWCTGGHGLLRCLQPLLGTNVGGCVHGRGCGACLTRGVCDVVLHAAGDWLWRPHRRRPLRAGGRLVRHDVREPPS